MNAMLQIMSASSLVISICSLLIRVSLSGTSLCRLIWRRKEHRKLYWPQSTHTDTYLQIWPHFIINLIHTPLWSLVILLWFYFFMKFVPLSCQSTVFQIFKWKSEKRRILVMSLHVLLWHVRLRVQIISCVHSHDVPLFNRIEARHTNWFCHVMSSHVIRNVTWS